MFNDRHGFGWECVCVFVARESPPLGKITLICYKKNPFVFFIQIVEAPFVPVFFLSNCVCVCWFSSIHRARRAQCARRGWLVPRNVRGPRGVRGALGQRTPACASGCGGELEQRLAPWLGPIKEKKQRKFQELVNFSFKRFFFVIKLSKQS